jgi:hypothetical protein
VRFEEIGERAGVAGAVWSVSCAFGDVDGDRDLDLYVTHYVDFSLGRGPRCRDEARNLPYYCHPTMYEGLSDDLFINQGDGTFRAEGRRRGLAQGGSERGLGVVMSDLDNDGDLDIYVTNDGTSNRLYLNRGDGYFDDYSLLSGTALSGDGARQAGMGIAAGDDDGDGNVDLVVTNFSLESNTLYQNEGGGLFRDATRVSGLHDATFSDLGWGTEFLDFDRDGDLDLAVANGHVMDNIDRFVPDLTYDQKNRLFANDGQGHFRDVSDEAGPAWRIAQVSRGLSVGDFDNDGAPDLLITNSNARPNLLHNETETANHWLGLKLIGPPSNYFAIGARVVLVAGGKRQVREVRSGGGVLGHDEFRPLFGLGTYTGAVTVEIRWPDGTRQQRTTSEIDRYWVLRFNDAR